MKNVCMIAYTNYSTDARVQREAETLVSDGNFNVHFITPYNDIEPKRYIKAGVEIIEFPCEKFTGKSLGKYLFSYLHFMLLCFIHCSRLWTKGRVDIVHVHNMPNFLVFAAIIPKIFGKKVVLDVHDTLIETYSSKYEGFAQKMMLFLLFLEERISCWFADRVICVNDIQRDILLKRGVPTEKILVLLNVPDPEIFKPLHKPTESIERKDFLVGYHGTIARRLGIDIAIRSIVNLRKKSLGISLLIIGDGDDRKDCERLVQMLEAGSYIRIMDLIPVAELPRMLKDVDLGIVPNRENQATQLMLPVKMLECIALGMPVLVPRLKTIEHYFNKEMVYFFDPNEPESIEKSLEEIYHDPVGREVKAMKAIEFLDEYGWQHQKKDLIRMYFSLSSSPSNIAREDISNCRIR